MVLSVLIVGLARVPWAGLTADVGLSLDIVALVVWWIAAFAFCFGTEVCRLLIFPLCFLFWLVPFPDFMLSRTVAWLQQGSSSAAQLLFAAAGVPVVRDGVMLSIPGLTIEVAKECSSIRSSLMLVVTTMVLAQLVLRSAWRKTLVVAVAVPLSLVKNGLRIFTIAMLGTRVDRGFLTGNLHHHGGVVFFLIALAGVFLLLWALRRTEGQIVPVRALDPVRS
jgi:exosortase